MVPSISLCKFSWAIELAELKHFLRDQKKIVSHLLSTAMCNVRVPKILIISFCGLLTAHFNYLGIKFIGNDPFHFGMAAILPFFYEDDFLATFKINFLSFKLILHTVKC